MDHIHAELLQEKTDSVNQRVSANENQPSPSKKIRQNRQSNTQNEVKQPHFYYLETFKKNLNQKYKTKNKQKTARNKVKVIKLRKREGKNQK